MFFLLAAPLLLCSTVLFAQKPDFSGTWVLNEGKSDMGQFGNIVPPKISAIQKADSLTAIKTNKSFDGSSETLSTETLSFDGKQIESTVPPNDGKRKASAKWSDDGSQLTITYTLQLNFNGEAFEVTGTEVWALADGGKTLTLTSKSNSSFGENTFKGVYEKQ